MLGACGDESPPPKPPAPVKLQIDGPSDTATVSGGSVDVRGTVAPAGARVTVLGRRAQVSAGSFTATVPVEEGANVIDVAATARGRMPAFAAVRISRESRIGVPDLVGAVADEARDQVEALGLEVDATRGGGLIDRLIPGDVVVCDQDPGPGAQVRRGSTVQLLVARSC